MQNTLLFHSSLLSCHTLSPLLTSLSPRFSLPAFLSPKMAASRSVKTKGGRVLMAEIGSDRHTLLYVPEYHWRELPQVSFLSRQTRICRAKYLSRQKFCREKHTFVAINTCLSRQTRVCRDNNTREARRLSRSKGGWGVGGWMTDC